jgi:predicted acyl esterase
MNRPLTLAATLALVVSSSLAFAQTVDLASGGSDIPETFSTVTESFDHTRLEVMIPMRDGVRLFTVVLIPKHGDGPMPIVLTRTPYDADEATSRVTSPRMAMSLGISDEPLVRNGYIRAYQDARGKHGSEGEYIMTLPPRGPLNSGAIDHGTDTWDTIDWLLANVPNNNGRVGITGVSYAGYLTLMALIDPHPALAAAIPVNPMVDGWIGDDWFHNGAFRVAMLDYVYAQTAAGLDPAHGQPSVHGVLAGAGGGSAAGGGPAQGADHDGARPV